MIATIERLKNGYVTDVPPQSANSREAHLSIESALASIVFAMGTTKHDHHTLELRIARAIEERAI